MFGSASFRLARPTTMSGETIIARRRKSDGKLVRVFPDGREEPFPDPGPLPHLTEDEINTAALADPDNPPRTPEREARLKRVPRVKSMRRAPSPHPGRVFGALQNPAWPPAGLGTGQGRARPGRACLPHRHWPRPRGRAQSIE